MIVWENDSDTIVLKPIEIRGKRGVKKKKKTIGFRPTTNYDSIISKTPEELAEWLWFKTGKCPPFDMCPSPRIPCEVKDCWLDWLKQETET